MRVEYERRVANRCRRRGAWRRYSKWKRDYHHPQFHSTQHIGSFRNPRQSGRQKSIDQRQFKRKETSPAGAKLNCNPIGRAPCMKGCRSQPDGILAMCTFRPAG